MRALVAIQQSLSDRAHTKGHTSELLDRGAAQTPGLRWALVCWASLLASVLLLPTCFFRQACQRWHCVGIMHDHARGSAPTWTCVQEKDEKSLAELRELNRKSKEETGEYMTEVRNSLLSSSLVAIHLPHMPQS